MGTGTRGYARRIAPQTGISSEERPQSSDSRSVVHGANSVYQLPVVSSFPLSDRRPSRVERRLVERVVVVVLVVGESGLHGDGRPVAGLVDRAVFDRVSGGGRAVPVRPLEPPHRRRRHIAHMPPFPGDAYHTSFREGDVPALATDGRTAAGGVTGDGRVSGFDAEIRVVRRCPLDDPHE